MMMMKCWQSIKLMQERASLKIKKGEAVMHLTAHLEWGTASS